MSLFAAAPGARQIEATLLYIQHLSHFRRTIFFATKVLMVRARRGDDPS
jgi:hypothetical protein